MAAVSLKEKGWYLTAEGIEDCTDPNNKGIGKTIQNAKDTDLRDIGEKWLPADVNKGKCEYVQGPGVLQIQKIRNVSAPKDNEESHYAPRLLKLTLTDGHITCNALETERLEHVGLETPPGTKICVKGTVEVEHGFLMLSNKNTNFIGGRVEKLAENWELKKMLSKQVRVTVGSEGGPPPFVPFGQRLRDNKPTKKDAGNFKSLDASKEKKSEDAEFEQQRQATIAEALLAKEDGKGKNFGGGQKQTGQDKDVAKIVEMGFTAFQASNALKQTNGNVSMAINVLLSNKVDVRGDRGGGGAAGRRDRPSNFRDKQEPPSQDQRRDRGRDRGNRNNEEEEETPSTKPSGPATLFDFLETKIKPSKEGKGTTQTSKDIESQRSLDSFSSKSENANSYNRRDPSRNQDPPPRFSKKDNYSDRTSYDNKSSKKFNERTDRQNSYDSDKPYRQSERKDQRGQMSRSDGEKSYSTRYDNESSHNYYNGGQRSSNYEKQKDGSNYSNRNNYTDKTDRYSDRPKSGYQERNYSNQQNYQKTRPKSSTESYSTGKENKSQQDTRTNPSQNKQSSKQRDSQNWNQDSVIQQDTGRGQRNPSQNKQGRSQNSSRDSFSQQQAVTDSSQQPRLPPNQNNYSQQGFDSYTQPPPIPQYMTAPPPQQFNNFVPNQNVYGVMWKRGDRCMAKYWEDNKFYSAIIECMAPNLSTCVVTFIDYGNEEEVNLSDVRPDPKFLNQAAAPNGSHGNQPLPQPAFVPSVPSENRTEIRSMEFRRRQPDQRDRGQQYYQPPNRQPLY